MRFHAVVRKFQAFQMIAQAVHEMLLTLKLGELGHAW
jgi:hypothetical protein